MTFFITIFLFCYCRTQTQLNSLTVFQIIQRHLLTSPTNSTLAITFKLSHLFFPFLQFIAQFLICRSQSKNLQFDPALIVFFPSKCIFLDHVLFLLCEKGKKAAEKSSIDFIKYYETLGRRRMRVWVDMLLNRSPVLHKKNIKNSPIHFFTGIKNYAKKLINLEK